MNRITFNSKTLNFKNPIQFITTFTILINKLHHGIMVDTAVIICYLKYHILCLKRPPLTDTHACSRLR